MTSFFGKLAIAFNAVVLAIVMLASSAFAVDSTGISSRFSVSGVISESKTGDVKQGVALLIDHRNQKKTVVVRLGDSLPGYDSFKVVSIKDRKVFVSDGMRKKEISQEAFVDSPRSSSRGDDDDDFDDYGSAVNSFPSAPPPYNSGGVPYNEGNVGIPAMPPPPSGTENFDRPERISRYPGDGLPDGVPPGTRVSPPPPAFDDDSFVPTGRQTPH